MTEKGWTVMKRTSMVVILVLGFVASFACTRTTPQQTQTPSTGTVLVKELPAGVEGLELRDGALRLKDGYEFVPGPGGTFTVSRIQLPTLPTSSTGGGCGCSASATGCQPVSKGGIIVCEGGCGTGTCGLALTVGGVKTDIIKW
jgi:hypothetical protein